MKLILFIYNIILILFMPFIAIIGYFIMKKKGKADYWFEHFGFIKKVEINKSKNIWFHCASVGEVRSIKNIVDELRSKYNDLGIIVSTMTATGKREAIKYLDADFAFLVPLENSPVITKIIKYYNVKSVVIVDTEIWPNFIYSTSSVTNLFLINGRISDKTFNSYKKFSFFFKPILNRFSAILTKSSLDEDRFIEISGNKNNIVTVGNIKFQQRKNKDSVSVIDELKNKNFILLASTHKEEEKILLEYIKDSIKLYDNLVICPRHIERTQEIKSIVESFNLSCGLYSENDFNKEVVIIDTFGKLEGLYVLASKIFIGGSLVNIGGHNIYEALQFNKTIASGSIYYNFSEIYDVANKYDLVTIIKNKDDATNWLKTKENDKFDFNGFFTEIDKINYNTINSVIETISSVIDIKVK